MMRNLNLSWVCVAVVIVNKQTTNNKSQTLSNPLRECPQALLYFPLKSTPPYTFVPTHLPRFTLSSLHVCCLTLLSLPLCPALHLFWYTFAPPHPFAAVHFCICTSSVPYTFLFTHLPRLTPLSLHMCPALHFSPCIFAALHRQTRSETVQDSFLGSTQWLGSSPPT